MGLTPGIAQYSLHLGDKSCAPLLRIPVELRLQIYSIYYRTITLSYPYSRHEATNLLLTCQQVHREARHELLPNVVYKFEVDESYYDFFSYFPALPTTTISSLRYLSLSHALCSATQVKRRPKYKYTIAAILPLFPGLQLDMLRLEDRHSDRYNPQAIYDVVSALVKCDGFKECLYISTRDGWLREAAEPRLRGHPETPGGDPDERVYYPLREPQPETWDTALKERDGKMTGADVRLFWVDCGGERMEVTGGYQSRWIGEHPEQVEEGYKRLKGDIGPCMGMGVEVRIRRGAGVDYVQRELPDESESDIADLDEWADLDKTRWVNEPDGALHQHARLSVVPEIKESRIKSWERRANGREICRSVLARQKPVSSRKAPRYLVQ